MNHEAIIVGAGRTAIGKFLGSLATQTAPQLGAAAIRGALERGAVEANDVDEVIMGHVLGAGVGQAPARQAALGAGIPPKVAAVTINKMCGSGLKAVMLAAQAVRLGDANIVVAGGMESMTNAPHVLHRTRAGWKFGDASLKDAMLLDGLWCAFEDKHMGHHAEYVAKTDGISREDQDVLAAESQRRAAQATTEGLFRNEIIPMQLPKRDAPFDTDEGVRGDTTLDSLSKLRGAFDANGTVTAGNASTLSDGAAAVIVTNPQTASQNGYAPLAKIVAYHTAGTEPRDLFIAPAFAIEGVLAKAGLTVVDIDLFEINEAFASQMLATMRRANVPHEKTNIHGGAIALGHPIGCSGTRALVTLLRAMQRQDAKRGLAALCLGGGNAVAMIVERL